MRFGFISGHSSRGIKGSLCVGWNRQAWRSSFLLPTPLVILLPVILVAAGDFFLLRFFPLYFLGKLACLGSTGLFGLL